MWKISVEASIFLVNHNSYGHIIYKLNYQLIHQIFWNSWLQDLQPEGWLQLVLKDLRARDQQDQSLPTPHQETQLKSFLKNYVDALTENTDTRFHESSNILDSFKIVDLLSVPAKTDDGFRYCPLLVLCYHGFSIKHITLLFGLCFLIHCFTISFS